MIVQTTILHVTSFEQVKEEFTCPPCVKRPLPGVVQHLPPVRVAPTADLRLEQTLERVCSIVVDDSNIVPTIACGGW